MCSSFEDGCPEGAGVHTLSDFIEVDTQEREVKEWVSGVSSCDD